MNTFGVTKLLPLRSLRTSFPDAFDDDGTHLVQFEGTFGLQLGDPFTLWRFILANQNRVAAASATAAAAVNDSSTSTVYGALGQFTPTPATDGSTTVFSLPFGYISGTLDIYIIYVGSGGGLLLINGTDYIESDNVAGEFTMTSPPLGTSALIARCLTLSS